MSTALKGESAPIKVESWSSRFVLLVALKFRYAPYQVYDTLLDYVPTL